MEYNFPINEKYINKIFKLSQDNLFIAKDSITHLKNNIRNDPEFVALILALVKLISGNQDLTTVESNKLANSCENIVSVICAGFELGYATAKLDSGELHA